jgi:deazaflavin-dependent oxidoreductase (nitroreductase family)
MAKQKTTFGLPRRALNAAVRAFAEHGWGPSFWYLLVVRGRKSGQTRSTPVAIMELDDHKWLVASYGVVDWVRNVRASKEVTLRRGTKSQTFTPVEVGTADAVRVLRLYLKRIPVARPYFDAKPDSPDEQIAAEAPRHPVFRLDAAG